MCTAISYISNDHYFGRTLDVEHLYGEYITVIPRNFQINFRHMETDKKHHAIIGMSTVVSGYPLLYDGVNEYGLCVAGLNFSGSADFPESTDTNTSITSFELPLLLLAKCKSTDEAVDILEKSVIICEDFNDKLGSAKLHWIVCDDRRCVTVEVLEKSVKIYENELGVMTNDPPFDYHIKNIRHYVHLSAKNITSRFWGGADIKANSRGAGSLGLPGDFTSESRFVRAAFVKANAKKCEGEGASVEQFFHILDSVSVPDGCVRLNGAFERTEYTSCCNATRGIYYYKTYENSRIRAVDMHQCRLDGNSLFTYPINEPTEFLYKG